MGVLIYDLFDFFTGTSICGLICLGFAFKVYREETLFCEMVGVFKDTVFINSSFLRICNKVQSSIWTLIFSGSIYCENTLELILQKKLVKILSNNENEVLKLSQESKNFLITVCKQDIAQNKLIPYCFTKFNNLCELNRITINLTGDVVEFHPEPLQNLSIGDVEAWEVARATSAAYPFFKPKKIGNVCFVDGGYQFNNRSFLALEFIRKKTLLADAREINVKKFYKSVFLLSVGLEDKRVLGSESFRWNAANDSVQEFMHIAEHCSIVNEECIFAFTVFGYEEKIVHAMNKLVNFSKAKSREKLGKGYVRIQPDFQVQSTLWMRSASLRNSGSWRFQRKRFRSLKGTKAPGKLVCVGFYGMSIKQCSKSMSEIKI